MTASSTLLHRDGTGEQPPGRGRLDVLRSRRALVLIAVGVLVLALFATWLVVFSTAFGVRTIEVRGVHSLSVAEVEGRADVAVGTPLVRVNTAAVTARVESLPEVYSAEVSTSFPSTLVISVVERTPVGYVRSGGAFDLLDRTGDAYLAVGTRPAGLPLLVVPSGAAASGARRAVSTVAVALDALPDASRPKIVSIQALAPNAITLVLTGNRLVQWGTAARSDDKARVLPILLRMKGHDQFTVSDPDQPYSR